MPPNSLAKSHQSLIAEIVIGHAAHKPAHHPSILHQPRPSRSTLIINYITSIIGLCVFDSTVCLLYFTAPFHLQALTMHMQTLISCTSRVAMIRFAPAWAQVDVYVHLHTHTGSDRQLHNARPCLNNAPNNQCYLPSSTKPRITDAHLVPTCVSLCCNKITTSAGR